jgi:Ca2+-binding EF-hand superfamily protein
MSCEELFKKLDVDCDGEISFEEFLSVKELLK